MWYLCSTIIFNKQKTSCEVNGKKIENQAKQNTDSDSRFFFEFVIFQLGSLMHHRKRTSLTNSSLCYLFWKQKLLLKNGYSDVRILKRARNN